MNLYEESGNQIFAKVFPVAGLVSAVIFAVVGFFLARQGVLAGYWFLCVGPVVSPGLFPVMGLNLAFSTRVTRGEVVSTSKLGEYIPSLAWRVPVPSIVEASVVDFELVAHRLKREGAGKGARITYMGDNKNETDFPEGRHSERERHPASCAPRHA